MIELPTVTLWAYATIKKEATIHALKKSMRDIRFGKVIVFTDDPASMDFGGCEYVHAEKQDYMGASVWFLTELPKHADKFTEHALEIQWDGFVVQPKAWQHDWLQYDYIGAPWTDGVVGNNAFWLCSRRFLKALADLKLPATPEACHPCDVRMCYDEPPWDGKTAYWRLSGNAGYRRLLEQAGMKWAPRDVAGRFSAENTEYVDSFGFHGTQTLLSVVKQGLFA